MDPTDEPLEGASAASRRKDKILQTRVPAGLVAILQEEARRRRVSVSHLIRGLLEDTFEIAQAFVAESGPLAEGARRVAASARALGGLAGAKDVVAWQEVVFNRAHPCSSCGSPIEPGERGLKSLSEGLLAAPIWLCRKCARQI